MPFSVREGINIFLAGFVPTENLRFRDEELNFKLSNNFEENTRLNYYGYPTMTKTMTGGAGSEAEVSFVFLLYILLLLLCHSI